MPWNLELVTTLLARLKGLFDMELFVRVCLVVWGTPFLAIALFAVAEFRPVDWAEWCVLALVVAFGAYGAFLLWLGLRGSDSRVESSMDLMSEGGELLGVVFALVVAVIAVPVTLLIRTIWKRRSG
jgi:hypothetical protein